MACKNYWNIVFLLLRQQIWESLFAKYCKRATLFFGRCLKMATGGELGTCAPP